MSVVDAPPGLDFAGPAAGEFRARRRPRRLARVTLVVCLLDGVATVALAAHQFHAPGTTMLLVGPLLCISIASVGYAVRSARVRVDTGGVHWGWQSLGVRMGRDRIEAIRCYSGALAIEPRRGSIWYLSKEDWERFEALPKAFADSGQVVEYYEGRAPIRARLQAYGAVLDGLMVLTLLGSALLLLFGAVR